MNRKRVAGCLCVLSVFLLYGVGKRYVFPTVERNIEEIVILPGTAHAGPVIEIYRQEIGEGQEKITYLAADIQLGDATDLRAAFAQNQYGLNIKDTVSGMAQEHDAFLQSMAIITVTGQTGLCCEMVFCTEMSLQAESVWSCIRMGLPVPCGKGLYRERSW